jgi:hypothetical protein
VNRRNILKCQAIILQTDSYLGTLFLNTNQIDVKFAVLLINSLTYPAPEDFLPSRSLKQPESREKERMRTD